MLELEEKTMQILSIQKSKQDLDTELKESINEISEGGKNVHELEKAKRRLESRIEELTTQLEEEEGNRSAADLAKISMENQIADLRLKKDADNAAKNHLIENNRRTWKEEVKSLNKKLKDGNALRNAESFSLGHILLAEYIPLHCSLCRI
jgi:myosin protein heavy chain